MACGPTCIFASSAVGEGDGVVTYGEAFNVQPFGNLLTTIPMTGAQVISVFEDQCQPPGVSRPFLHLGISQGLTYSMQFTLTPHPTIAGRIDCTAITVSNVQLNGVPLDPSATYEVTVNNFLVDGGDNFVTFREVPANARVGAGIDLDALIAYLDQQGPVAPPGTNRVIDLP